MITYLQDKQLVVEDRSATSGKETITTHHYPDHYAKVRVARVCYHINHEMGEPNA